MPTEQEYAIGELADLAGVTPRTIRYYVSIGLLPAPESAGPKTRYTDGHLKRLRLIRHLQRQHLPLAEIGQRLAGLAEEAVAEALDAGVSVRPTDSALEYIDRLKGTVPSGAAARELRMAKEISPTEPWITSQALAETRPTERKAPLDTRTRWERVPLGEHVELHIRQPLDRRTHKQIERLIRLGREMLEEGD
ncbi:MAG TPA: MerR family transcriptional regulator [Anaerolineae bacterium]|jgi:DNA-binding transcriptional MerR regulator|nr:MerR family transcriptional regulator [Anaerolineae bacterium]